MKACNLLPFCYLFAILFVNQCCSNKWMQNWQRKTPWPYQGATTDLSVRRNSLKIWVRIACESTLGSSEKKSGAEPLHTRPFSWAVQALPTFLSQQAVRITNRQYRKYSPTYDNHIRRIERDSKKLSQCLAILKHHHHHQYSARRPVMAGTRAQSGDRYGSGTLHSRQFLTGRLPLLSPAFRRSHFRL